MQTGETRIKPKAELPPNANPMELDHVRSRVSNPSFRLSMVKAIFQTFVFLSARTKMRGWVYPMLQNLA
jgi:hypothetical protein